MVDDMGKRGPQPNLLRLLFVSFDYKFNIIRIIFIYNNQS